MVFGINLYLIVFLKLFQFYYAIEVTIEDGTLLGTTMSSRGGREYYGFMGIPFAKPPIGDLRFEPPQPPEHWKGVKDATQMPPGCIQKEAFTFMAGTLDVMGQEDCLYLNVFTPKITKNNLLPVMVWIHGGGFVNGQSTYYDALYFMDQDVVIVTIQYRLEILGFLTTLDDVIPGNMGMKDQVMALKWVQKNIKNFGGDPNKVTIFGQSAGAASVHLHMYSPLSVGLFQRGIAHSGTGVSPWSYLPRKMARERIITFGVLTGCPTNNSHEFVNCLRKVPAKELVNVHWKFYIWITEPVNTFVVVSEPKTVKGAFLHDNPKNMAELSKVPLVTGINSEDGLCRVLRYLHDGASELDYLNDNYERLLPVSLYYGRMIEPVEKVNQITEALKKFYFGGKDMNVENVADLVRLFTDAMFSLDATEIAKRRWNTTTTFFYKYEHRNENSIAELYGDDHDHGVAHGEELISLFSFGGVIPEVTEGNDLKVSLRMINYWVNFATTGKPDPNNVWIPIKSDDVEYLHITTDKDVMKTNFFKDGYQFWKSLNLDKSRIS